MPRFPPSDQQAEAVVWLLITFVVGLALGSQPAINAKLAAFVGGPLSAAAISVISAGVIMIAVMALTRTALPSLGQLKAVPPWLWSGGVIGAAFVTVALLATPRLGAGVMIALLVAGQMTAALVIDQFGLFGLDRRAIDLPRVLGALCLLAGVVLIRLR